MKEAIYIEEANIFCGPLLPFGSLPYNKCINNKHPISRFLWSEGQVKDRILIVTRKGVFSQNVLNLLVMPENASDWNPNFGIHVLLKQTAMH